MPNLRRPIRFQQNTKDTDVTPKDADTEDKLKAAMTPGASGKKPDPLAWLLKKRNK